MARRKLVFGERLLARLPLFFGKWARFAEIDFDEACIVAELDSDRDAKPAALKFWSIDEEKDLATPRTPLEWAIEAGFAPGVGVEEGR